MKKQICIIARQEDGTILIDCELHETVNLVVLEQTIDENGWKHYHTIFNNLTDEKKSKMLEHLTPQNNADIL